MKTIKSHTAYDKSALSLYIKEAKRFPLLTREQEYTTAVNALAGSRPARDKLINSNLLLVVKIAHEYVNVFSNVMDLIGEGNTGLMKAIDKYDPNRGYRFSTYSGWWCRCMMLHYIFNNSYMIKPGSTNEQKKLFYNLRKEQKRLASLGIEADAATIAENLDVSEAGVVAMDNRLQTDVYLDAPVMDDDGEEQSIFDYVPCEESKQPDKIMESMEHSQVLRTRLNTFASKLRNDRYRKIFHERIMAEEDEKKTLQALGDDFGISKQRTKQLEEAIVKKLRVYMKEAI